MGFTIVKQIALAHKGNFQIKEEGHTVRLALLIIVDRFLESGIIVLLMECPINFINKIFDLHIF